MSKQIVLFPQKIDEKIAENDPVRVLDAFIESIDLSCLYKLYKRVCQSVLTHPLHIDGNVILQVPYCCKFIISYKYAGLFLIVS